MYISHAYARLEGLPANLANNFWGGYHVPMCIYIIGNHMNHMTSGIRTAISVDIMYKLQRVGLQGNMCACRDADIGPSFHGTRTGTVEEVREVRKVGSGAVLRPSLAATSEPWPVL